MLNICIYICVCELMLVDLLGFGRINCGVGGKVTASVDLILYIVRFFMCRICGFLF